MSSTNTEQLKISKEAHTWLTKLSQEWKKRGTSYASMTRLASDAILAIPMPNGHKPDCQPCADDDPLTDEEKM
jgi:hypothetical protein